MLTELAVMGTVLGFVVGLFEFSHRLEDASPGLSPETLVQKAMRGPDGLAVRAEFRRSGIQHLDGRREIGFRA
ncbi:MAG TPA: hypothetical protein VGW35_02005 [Methylomirabilota bacterium]|jgi:hypothetical protein|nr:hypothetical protein [Methylomirabilota bacterium]